MAYWRMQLHPAESASAVKHTVESLSAATALPVAAVAR